MRLFRLGVLGGALALFQGCFGLFMSTESSFNTSAGGSDGGSGGGSGNSGGTSTKDLVVNIDFLDVGVRSNTSQTTFNRSAISLDTSYYDGSPSYFFEVTGRNYESARDVELVDSGNTARSSITVTGSTFTRYRAAFTPNTGADVYRVRVPATATANNFDIVSARIVIVQNDASKTRLYIPLTSRSYGAYSNSDTASLDSYVLVPWGRSNQASFVRLLNRFASAYSSVSGYTFEAVLSATGGGTASAALYNDSTSQVLLSSAVSTTLPTPQLLSASFTTDAHFTTNQQLSVATRMAGGGTSTELYRSGLWITLSSIEKAEIYQRVGLGMNTSLSATFHEARGLLDLNLFTNPTVYFESAIQTSAGSPTINLVDLSNSDTSNTGSDVSGSTFTATTSWVINRSAPLSVNSGNRFGVRTVAGTVLNHGGAFVVIGIE